jgi:hypothetical protein
MHNDFIVDCCKKEKAGQQCALRSLQMPSHPKLILTRGARAVKPLNTTGQHDLLGERWTCPE